MGRINILYDDWYNFYQPHVLDMHVHISSCQNIEIFREKIVILLYQSLQSVLDIVNIIPTCEPKITIIQNTLSNLEFSK